VNVAGWLCQEKFRAVPLISAAEISWSHMRPTCWRGTLASGRWHFHFSQACCSEPTHRTAKDKAGGVLGVSCCRSDRVLTCGNISRKLLILVVIYLVERVDKASSGYRCSGLGLMFSSIQAMNTAGLCHSGQTVMLGGHNHVSHS